MTSDNLKLGYELVRYYPVSPATLFDAFLSENILKQLWGVRSIQINAEVGKESAARMQTGDEYWDFRLKYETIDPARKLQWLVYFDRFPDKEFQVSLDFKPVDDGVELTVCQQNFDNTQERDNNKNAWGQALEKLLTLIN